MNIDIDGKCIFIQRMPFETDSELLNRKFFVLNGLNLADSSKIKDEDILQRLKLSEFFHNISTKNVTYPDWIQTKIR